MATLCLICYQPDGAHATVPHVHGDRKWKAEQLAKMKAAAGAERKSAENHLRQTRAKGR